MSTATTHPDLGTFPIPGENIHPDEQARMIGGLFLHELRRSAATVTRANQGSVEVRLTPLSTVPRDDVAAAISDATVLLGFDPPEGDGYAYSVRLTSGEARSMAAILLRAADELDFDDFEPYERETVEQLAKRLGVLRTDNMVTT